MRTLKRLLALLALAALALACVDVRVDVQRFGQYSLVKVSYEVTCVGNYKIVLKTNSSVYSYSGNAKVYGNEYVWEGVGFPGAVGGFNLKVLGPLEGTLTVEFNGKVIEKYVFGVSECLAVGLSRSSFYTANGEATSFTVNLLNYCNETVTAKVEVTGGKPLKELTWYFCSKGKGEAKYQKVCVEEKCLQWRVVGEVCSKKVKRCTWVPGVGEKCEEKCLEKAPVYSCVRSKCNVSYWVPHEVRTCLKYERVVRKSDFAVVDGKEVAEVALKPGKGVSLTGYFQGSPRAIEVNVNGSAISLEREVRGPVTHIDPGFAAFVLFALALALIAFYVT